MIGFFVRVYKRYLTETVSVKINGFPIYASDHSLVAAVDFVDYGLRSKRLVGWTLGPSVRVIGSGAKSFPARLTGRRLDAEQAVQNNDCSATGFEVLLPIEDSCEELIFELPDGAFRVHLPAPPSIRRLFSRIKGTCRFIQLCATNTVPILRYLQRKTEPNKALLKQVFGFSNTSDHPIIDSSLFTLNKCKPTFNQRVTIVLPVYNAFDVLLECLDRVASNSVSSWRLIVVEDCSSDQRVAPFLRSWCAKCENSERISLIENSKNLGFVRSVNKGIMAAKEFGDPVILLNSDALVAYGWDARMLAPFSENRKIASVSPLSNNAEILTVPKICQANPLRTGAVDFMDRIARETCGGLVEIPTGIGFCMAMNPLFLAKVTQLDEIFGSGYGEEVDWCQKVRQLDGIHVCHTGVFVEHKGGMSFGSKEKQTRIARNNQIISKRYPGYDKEVETFIKNDPLISVRLCLAIAERAKFVEKMPVYIGHSMGGGAERYLAAEISKLIKQGLTVVVLRVGGAHRWAIELHSSDGVIAGVTNDFEVVLTTLQHTGPREVVYSCAVGDCNPEEIPEYVDRLLDGDDHCLKTLFHDYFPISPSYCLLSGTGEYLGVPNKDSDDRTHSYINSNGQLISLKVWRNVWGRMLEASQSITAFSESSRALIEIAYPEVAEKISVSPHCLPYTPSRIFGSVKGDCVIGVLGGINLQKGAQIIVDLAEKLPEMGGKLVIIGNLDPAYSEQKNVHQTGAYEPEQISELASQYGIRMWLIPSIWPETFSYTTHEALATGLPVIGFAVGAQGDALAAAPNGSVLPLRNGPEAAENVLQEIKRILSNVPARKDLHRKSQKSRSRGFAAR